MGGANDGNLFDGFGSIDTTHASLDESTIREIYATPPEHLAAVAEKAVEADNPELAIIISVFLAARSVENSLNIGTRRRPKFLCPSRDHTHADYTNAFFRVSGLMKALAPEQA